MSSVKKVSSGTRKELSRAEKFFQQSTDTFKELAGIFLGMIVLGGGLYAIFENENFFQGIWWAFVTAFTVGYGDQVPHTVAGQVVAAGLMTISVFVIIPLITALMAKRMIVDNDAWTNEEQTELMQNVAALKADLDQRSSQKASSAKTVDAGTATLKPVKRTKSKK